MAAPALSTLIVGCSLLLLLLPQLLLLASPSQATASETPPARPKRNATRIIEMVIFGEMKFIEARKDDDRRPSYAVIHAALRCGGRSEIQGLFESLANEEYWPDVFFRYGQDAKPTLYVFTADKKYVHRVNIEDKTTEEIKELLNGFGFYGSPFPKAEETEAQPEVEAKKSEL